MGINLKDLAKALNIKIDKKPTKDEEIFYAKNSAEDLLLQEKILEKLDVINMRVEYSFPNRFLDYVELRTLMFAFGMSLRVRKEEKEKALATGYCNIQTVDCYVYKQRVYAKLKEQVETIKKLNKDVEKLKKEVQKLKERVKK